MLVCCNKVQVCLSFVVLNLLGRSCSRESGVPSLPAGCAEGDRVSFSPACLGSFANNTVMARGLISEVNCSLCLILYFFAETCFLAGAWERIETSSLPGSRLKIRT